MLAGISNNSSSSASVTNSTYIAPIFNLGGTNENDLESKLEQSATSSALNKDTTDVGASVGVGLGGSGSGGQVDKVTSTGSDGMFFDKKITEASQLDTKTVSIAGGVIAGVGLLSYFIFRKKK